MSRYQYKPKPLPPLRPSHAPQAGPPRDLFKRMHATMVAHWPFERADDIPYGVWITKDGEQILFDRQYARCGGGLERDSRRPELIRMNGSTGE
jgi:hypothetical protein